ncbi:MAG TPA: hypothetical protein PKY81_10280 [bacterium]|nr:hypothetical protein [bacterium]HPN31333.1 hypothetical protein [bacterium]
MNSKITIEYSTMCFNEQNYLQKINEAKKFLESEGFDFGIQIHNSIGAALYSKLAAIKDDFSFTVHSPVFADYFFNLAYPDFDALKKQCQNALKHLIFFNADLLFFHGFFMTGKLIPHDMINYRKTIKSHIPEKYRLNDSFIMNPEYFDSDEFENYKTIFKKNYAELQKQFPDFKIALENDFVGVGSGLQRPQEILELTDNLWFDAGHLWCSSLLHNFDFYEASYEIISKKNIVGVHLNHNLMDSSTEKIKIRDSHTHLYCKNSQNLKPVIKTLLNNGIQRYTLEIEDGDIEDVKILASWL